MLKGIGEGATYFYHPDHLGSVSVVSNHKGVPYERVEYLPFGEVWIEDVDPATRYIPFRFTSKELDRETGLYYYGARYYEPKVSRWMSADPAGFALVNPMGSNGKPKSSYSVIEAVNWYSYVSNNPVKYVDPTGFDAYDTVGIDTPEKRAAFKLLGPIGSSKAQRIVDDRRDAAILYAQANGLFSAQDNEADAYRHFTWNVENTYAFGESKAKVIGDNHEIYDVGGFGNRADSQMDLWNNSLGRQFAEMYSESDSDSLWELANALGLTANTTSDPRLSNWASDPGFTGEVKIDAKMQNFLDIASDMGATPEATLKAYQNLQDGGWWDRISVESYIE